MNRENVMVSPWIRSSYDSLTTLGMTRWMCSSSSWASLGWVTSPGVRVNRCLSLILLASSAT